MKALTPGEVIIFATTYSHAFAEHFSAAAERYDRSLTREQAAAGWSQEVGLKLMADAGLIERSPPNLRLSASTIQVSPSITPYPSPPLPKIALKPISRAFHHS